MYPKCWENWCSLSICLYQGAQIRKKRHSNRNRRQQLFYSFSLGIQVFTHADKGQWQTGKRDDKQVDSDCGNPQLEFISVHLTNDIFEAKQGSTHLNRAEGNVHLSVLFQEICFRLLHKYTWNGTGSFHSTQNHLTYIEGVVHVKL